jgi:hypothetical protein
MRIQDLPALRCPFTGRKAYARRFVPLELEETPGIYVEYSAKNTPAFVVEAGSVVQHEEEMSDLVDSLMGTGEQLLRRVPGVINKLLEPDPRPAQLQP